MRLSALRILLVDDYEPLRYLKTILLQRAGAVVLEARTGQEALQILQTQTPDVALLDINLPDMSALKLGELMHEDSRLAAIPLIYTSASDRPERLASDAVFFQEPIDKTELVETVHRMASPGKL